MSSKTVQLNKTLTRFHLVTPTQEKFKLKCVLYKTNKLIMIYSYVITSLPEEAQVYNNTTMSSFYSSKFTITPPLIPYSSLGDSCTGRAEEDGPADAWLVETAGFTGWLAIDGLSS